MTKRSGLVCAWWVAALAVAASVTVGTSALRAQCTTPTGDTGFNDVIYSQAAGTFSTVLPFDVPVRICADVPDGTTRATVKYAASNRKLGPIDVDTNTCEIRTPGIQWGPAFERAPTGNTVRWVIGRLEAERYYVFCFEFDKKATDDEIATFRQSAATELDDNLAKVDSATLTSEQTQAICQGLRAQLLEVTGASKVLTPGTIFDCDP
jgi:hypothetical protein